MDDRLEILVVAAYAPFRPRSGAPMRVHHLLRRLAARHRVTLLCLAGPGDEEGAGDFGAELDVRLVQRPEMSVAAKRAAQLASLASRTPFSCREVHFPAMQRAIDELCAERAFDVIQIEASLLCAYSFPRDVPCVIDEHNIESEIFERMPVGERSATRRAFSWLECRRYRSFERHCWRRVDACAVTSEREARIVAVQAPRTPTGVVVNGVDLDYFAPSREEPRPRTLVFNGTLGYRPNIDAAHHLVDDIWPRITEACPDARLAIVGRGHPDELQRLRRPGVEVTGEVPDVRPYLRAAAVVAVPIRMGGGTRLKVLEGLAMGRPMVSTTLGAEGISVHDGKHLLIADDADAFAADVVRLFEDPALGYELGTAGRARMEREYSWDIAGARLDALIRTAHRSRARTLAARQTPLHASSHG